MTDVTTEAVAHSDIDAVGSHDLDPLDQLLDPDVVAVFDGEASGEEEWIAALCALLPILVRNDIRDIVAVGERACVVYDCVTSTEAGAVLCVEVLTVRNGRITGIESLLDRIAFAPAYGALRELASA